jgi:hypothetical protein
MNLHSVGRRGTDHADADGSKQSLCFRRQHHHKIKIIKRFTFESIIMFSASKHLLPRAALMAGGLHMSRMAMSHMDETNSTAKKTDQIVIIGGGTGKRSLHMMS